ncbi:MAG TPA: hypothetical protein VF897_08250 [Roseiflexaceae bacterium]
MRLRLALGIGALALLIVALVAWGGFTQRSVRGTIAAVGAGDLRQLTLGEDDVGALLLCAPDGGWPAAGQDRGGAVFVHVLPFTRVVDGRGRWMGMTARFESLRAGQRVQVWATNTAVASSPPQIYALKIQIDGDLAAGQAPDTCR